jgi:hypothetical protein
VTLSAETRGKMLRMMTQQQIISTVHQVAGSPLSVLERTARNLTKVGLLPEPGSEWLPEDAACFVLAVAAGRSPGEAVDAVNTYRSTTLSGARFMSPAGFVPLAINDAVPSELRDTPIAALSYFLGGVPAGVVARQSLRLAIHRSIQAPLASLYAEFAQGVMQLEYGTGRPLEQAALVPIMIVPSRLIAAVAAQFGNESGRPLAQPIGAALH